MASRRAAELFIRLAAHHPALGGGDTAAQVRALDWTTSIDRVPEDRARAAIEDLIAWPDHQGVPRLGDFHEACRRMAAYDAIPTARELEAPPEVAPDRERLDAILAQARQALGRPA